MHALMLLGEGGSVYAVRAVVSRAFSCLSDSDKRAAYDRYGEEAPGLTRTRSAQEFDPNEIFNAFFGGGFGGGGFQGAA